jgi:hypothetical protein
MIRVRIDILPYGEEMEAYPIGTFDIWNTGERVKRGMSAYDGVFTSAETRVVTEVKGILHKRSNGIHELLTWAFDFLACKLEEANEKA